MTVLATVKNKIINNKKKTFLRISSRKKKSAAYKKRDRQPVRGFKDCFPVPESNRKINYSINGESVITDISLGLTGMRNEC